jgi:hypothetical protein
MKITAEELKAIYRDMSDEELLSLDRDDLTDVALQVHREELGRRGLDLETEIEEAADAEPQTVLHSFDLLDEARSAESMLESAGIPAHLENDTLRGRGFRLMVPATMVEDARLALKGPAAIADTDAIIVSARYEGGVFVPLQEIDIREGAVVEVHIQSSDLEG